MFNILVSLPGSAYNESYYEVFVKKGDDFVAGVYCHKTTKKAYFTYPVSNKEKTTTNYIIVNLLCLALLRKHAKNAIGYIDPRFY